MLPPVFGFPSFHERATVGTENPQLEKVGQVLRALDGKKEEGRRRGAISDAGIRVRPRSFRKRGRKLSFRVVT